MADGENAAGESELLETGNGPGGLERGRAPSEHRLELSGMRCESCERLVRRAAHKAGAEVRAIDANAGFATFACEDAALPALKKALAEKGFAEKGGAEGGRGDFARVWAYVRGIMAGEEEVAIENALLNYSLGAFAGLALVAAGIYMLAFSGLPNAPGYAPLLLLVVGTSVALAFSYYHLGTYRRSLSCSNGMMAGMALGMIAGFLVSALLGATNGMFVGTVAGMAAGIAFGVGIGRHCGVMGGLEGVMAGLMAGAMGAMLSVMMVNDNLLLFLYILFALCAVVLGGLSYMMHREAAEAPSRGELRAGFGEFAGFAAVLVLGMALLMAFGPKVGLIYP